MKFTEIKVKDLVSFVDSPEFKQMNNLPISSLRARSQSINPAADANDTALIYAENDESLIIGYIGVLPARAYTSSSVKIYFISCWWVNPETGRSAAMKLFYRMLELTERKVFFFHLPEKMAAILKAMDAFTFPAPNAGFKGFFKLDIEEWVLKKNPNLKFIKPILTTCHSCVFLAGISTPTILSKSLTLKNLFALTLKNLFALNLR